MNPRLIATGFLSACLGLTSVASAQIIEDFSAGHGLAPGGGYTGDATDGWSSPWLPKRADSSVTVDRDVVDTNPLVRGGGNYLLISGISVVPGVWGVSRQYAVHPNREYRNVRRDRAHVIRFDLRIDDLSGWSKGEDFAIGDAQSAQENYGLGPISTIAIRAHQSDTGSAKANRWAVYDGNRDGTFQSSRYIDTGISLTTGVTYTFIIRMRPATRSWIVTIDDGTQRFTSGLLGFRAGGLGSGILSFFRTTNSRNDATTFSLDNLLIEDGE